MKNVIAERVIHDGENRVTLRFPIDNELIKIVKGLPNARWSRRMKCWHISDRKDVISLLLNAFNGKAYIDYSAMRVNLAEKIRFQKKADQKKNQRKSSITADSGLAVLSEKGEADVSMYRRWMESHRYPESTIRTYTGMITTFLRFMKERVAWSCSRRFGQGQEAFKYKAVEGFQGSFSSAFGEGS